MSIVSYAQNFEDVMRLVRRQTSKKCSLYLNEKNEVILQSF